MELASTINKVVSLIVQEEQQVPNLASLPTIGLSSTHTIAGVSKAPTQRSFVDPNR